MGLLDSWSPGDHWASGVRHPTYRKGTGPGVIVIHEIPGLTPAVIGFGEELVAAGYTVVMPHLFGTPERPMTALSVASTLRQVCVSREFTKLATRQTSPVAGWLRSLARDLHAELNADARFERAKLAELRVVHSQERILLDFTAKEERLHLRVETRRAAEAVAAAKLVKEIRLRHHPAVIVENAAKAALEHRRVDEQ